MKCLRLVVAAVLCLLLGLPSHSDDAKTAYTLGMRAESENKYDDAFKAFQQAFSLKPKNAKYEAAYLRARARAAEKHVDNGIKLRSSQKLTEAMTEFQMAVEIDGSDFAAVQEMQITANLLKKQAEPVAPTKTESLLGKLLEQAQGPVELEPSPNTPITLRMTTTADNIYRTIGKLGGINVLFDLDYKPQKITIELNEVMMREALKMVAMESKTFWRPISPTAIFVSSEGKRKEFETNVMRTFYLRNTATSGELQEVAGTLKGILDINRIQVNPTHSSITLRGTPDQLVLAEKLVSDIDKPKAEVMIDVAVMQVSRDRLTNLGTTVPTSATVSLQSAAAAATGAGAAASLVRFGWVNGRQFVTTIPSVTFTALATDSKTKILQKPQIRALDNEKATLKIGDRVPVATGSFAAGIGSAGVSPLVNTQFQYIDVGVNIDITPHVHSDREVTLKMVLEISSVTGQQNIGGVIQPIIGQRRIEHETRLADGEINLVGGILQDSETKSLSGYPWLMKIPILSYLFAQDDRQHNESEIIFAITPHIVRAELITAEDMKLIEVGSGNNIGLRYQETKPSKANGPGSTPDTSAPPSARMRKSNTTQPQPQGQPKRQSSDAIASPASELHPPAPLPTTSPPSSAAAQP
jgi:general secretion pathway protein D